MKIASMELELVQEQRMKDVEAERGCGRFDRYKKESGRGLKTVGVMSGEENENTNPLRRRRRHATFQTLRLEAYFEEWRHPNERQRRQLGRELGLTPTQIKFWFQNKRTLVKAQNERLEGNALRAENERLKLENRAILEILKDDYLCTPCKGLSVSEEEQQLILEQLRMENAQLNEKFEKLRNLVGNMGTAASEVHSPATGSSLDASIRSFPRQRMGGLSLDHGSRNFDDPTFLYQLKEMKESDKLGMIQTVVNAIDEMASLLVAEPLWIKDLTDGRYVLHRNDYEKTFPRVSHLKGSRARFESSKEEGIVRMSGAQVVGMLIDSAKRVDLFPTIITKGLTIQQLETPSGSLSGSLQLVYEQMHILSPLVAPREFHFLRYCERINESEWIIVEVSYDFFNESQQTSPFRSWRLPSGCFIKDLSNGFSKVTWIEHVEVDDKALTHPLYRDFIFRGLAYGAERWILTLQRMCERFAFEMGRTAVSQELGGVICIPEGRRSIMSLTHRMVKNLCASLSTKQKMDIPQPSELSSSGIRFSIWKSTGLGQPHGMVISASTSLWLPVSSQPLFDFLSSGKMRSQWDAMSEGNPYQEIAKITYREHPGNNISIIQPFSEDSMLRLQESCVDLLGAVIVYASIDIRSLEMAVSGVDSSSIPILPSGFIISSDSYPCTGANGASSSTSTPSSRPSGSLLTAAFQILTGDDSDSQPVNMQLVTSLNTVITSTIQNIKTALNCTDLD